MKFATVVISEGLFNLLRSSREFVGIEDEQLVSAAVYRYLTSDHFEENFRESAKLVAYRDMRAHMAGFGVPAIR